MTRRVDRLEAFGTHSALVQQFDPSRELARELPNNGCIFNWTTTESLRLMDTNVPITATERLTEIRSTYALVISSSEKNRVALSAVLSSGGLVPIPCSSEAEACTLIERNQIDIVFCDDCLSSRCLGRVIAMASERRKPIPVIAVSRTGEWHEYLEALELGAFDYLSLPPRRDELDRVLASSLGRGSSTNRAKVEAAN